MLEVARPKDPEFRPKDPVLFSGVGILTRFDRFFSKLDRKDGSKLLLSDNTGLVIAQPAIAEILRSN